MHQGYVDVWVLLSTGNGWCWYQPAVVLVLGAKGAPSQGLTSRRFMALVICINTQSAGGCQ